MATPEVSVTNAVNSISPSTSHLSINRSTERFGVSMSEQASTMSDDEERRAIVMGCMAISNV